MDNYMNEGKRNKLCVKMLNVKMCFVGRVHRWYGMGP